MWCQVVFNLHPTFPNPTREVTVHPFEIEEHGWGEFELNVTVPVPLLNASFQHMFLPSLMHTSISICTSQ